MHWTLQKARMACRFALKVGPHSFFPLWIPAFAVFPQTAREILSCEVPAPSAHAIHMWAAG